MQVERPVKQYWGLYLSCVIHIRTGCGGAGTHVPKINFDHGT